MVRICEVVLKAESEAGEFNDFDRLPNRVCTGAVSMKNIESKIGLLICLSEMRYISAPAVRSESITPSLDCPQRGQGRHRGGEIRL